MSVCVFTMVESNCSHNHTWAHNSVKLNYGDNVMKQILIVELVGIIYTDSMNEIVSFLELNTLDYCFLLNLFTICLYLCLFNLIRWCYMPVGCTCNGGP